MHEHVLWLSACRGLSQQLVCSSFFGKMGSQSQGGEFLMAIISEGIVGSCCVVKTVQEGMRNAMAECEKPCS